MSIKAIATEIIAINQFSIIMFTEWQIKDSQKKIKMVRPKRTWTKSIRFMSS